MTFNLPERVIITTSSIRSQIPKQHIVKSFPRHPMETIPCYQSNHQSTIINRFGVLREIGVIREALQASRFDTSSATPFPSKASKKKKFFNGSPLPDIAFITSYKTDSMVTHITCWKRLSSITKGPLYFFFIPLILSWGKDQESDHKSKE